MLSTVRKLWKSMKILKYIYSYKATSDLSNLNIDEYFEYKSKRNIHGSKLNSNQRIEHVDLLDKNSEYMKSRQTALNS